MRRVLFSSRAVTLFELMVALMVLSLILTAAVKTWDVTLRRGRFQSTQRKLDQLATVIVGDPGYTVDGQRVDFGFVGDIGRLPLFLGELVDDPTGLPPDSSSWQGPYIRATFDESAEGYRIDGWGDTIVYSRESLFVRSYAGFDLTKREEWITRELGYTRDELLRNTVDGRMLDIRGMPPPESLLLGHPLRFRAELEYPVGGIVQATPAYLDSQGRFSFIAVPQGIHLLRVIYIHDTPPPVVTYSAEKYVTVYPRVGARDIQVRLDLDWNTEGGG